jgi:type IV pilus assembly protein PilA
MGNLNTLRKLVGKDSGVTMLELMVVVALIGILVAIAVPNYQKYQARALQTEAKTGLGGLYSAEKMFALENQSYTACITKIGFEAYGGNSNTSPAKRYYAIGVNPTGMGNVCGPGVPLTSCLAYEWNDAGGATANCTDLTHTLVEARVVNNSVAARPNNYTFLGSPSPNIDISKTVFIARAGGNISSSLSAYDKWSIDHEGTLKNFDNQL